MTFYCMRVLVGFIFSIIIPTHAMYHTQELNHEVLQKHEQYTKINNLKTEREKIYVLRKFCFQDYFEKKENNTWKSLRMNFAAALLAINDAKIALKSIKSCILIITNHAVYFDDQPFMEFLLNLFPELDINHDCTNISHYKNKQIVNIAQSFEMLMLLIDNGANIYTDGQIEMYSMFNKFDYPIDWRIIKFYFDHKVKWTNQSYAPFEQWVSDFAYCTTINKTNLEKYLSDAISILYVLSRTPHWNKETFQNMVFLINADIILSSDAKQIIKTIKHLYCCCNRKNQRIFTHTPQLPDAQDLMFDWVIYKQKTDISMNYYFLTQ